MRRIFSRQSSCGNILRFDISRKALSSGLHGDIIGISRARGSGGQEPTDNGNDQSEGAASDPAQAPAKKSLFSRLFGKR